MKKKSVKNEIPLSSWAKSRISGNWGNYFGATTVLSVVVGAVWFFVCCIRLILGFYGKTTGASDTVWGFKEFLFWITVFVISDLLVFLINYILCRWYYVRKKKELLFKNEKDYEQSLRLKPVLDKFCSVNISEFSVLEQMIEGSWKPFRIEHFLSDSIKSEIIAKTKLNLFSVESTVKGVSYSRTMPNLLDSSSILFLKDNEGKTLRALIPSPRITKEMIAGSMEKWFEDSLKRDGSHTNKILKECSFSEKDINLSVSHPRLIDSLDSSCELNFNQRPSLNVIGQEIQEGVVIATALEINEKKSIFLPTGFFKKLTEGISSAVQNVLPEPMVIEAIQ